eukprot:COSAG01_NODE_3353_length_6219_cov_30.047059_3_plen_172_part_00
MPAPRISVSAPSLPALPPGYPHVPLSMQHAVAFGRRPLRPAPSASASRRRARTVAMSSHGVTVVSARGHRHVTAAASPPPRHRRRVTAAASPPPPQPRSPHAPISSGRGGEGGQNKSAGLCCQRIGHRRSAAHTTKQKCRPMLPTHRPSPLSGSHTKGERLPAATGGLFKK